MSLKNIPTHLVSLSGEGVVNCDQYVGVRIIVGTYINARDPLSKKMKVCVSTARDNCQRRELSSELNLVTYRKL